MPLTRSQTACHSFPRTRAKPVGHPGSGGPSGRHPPPERAEHRERDTTDSFALDMAAAFLAMNKVFGNLFDVSEAEAANPDVAAARAEASRGQFIMDVQTHFVHDQYTQKGILGLAVFASQHWNPALAGKTDDLYIYKFENYVRQIFLNSDTSIALLSGAPFDDHSWEFLQHDQIREAANMVNRVGGEG